MNHHIIIPPPGLNLFWHISLQVCIENAAHPILITPSGRNLFVEFFSANMHLKRQSPHTVPSVLLAKCRIMLWTLDPASRLDPPKHNNTFSSDFLYQNHNYSSCERVAPDKRKSQFYPVFEVRPSFRAKCLPRTRENRNFTPVFDVRPSFRAKGSQ